MPAHLCEMPCGRREARLAVVVTTVLTIPAVHDLLTPDFYRCPHDSFLEEVLAHARVLVVF